MENTSRLMWRKPCHVCNGTGKKYMTGVIGSKWYEHCNYCAGEGWIHSINQCDWRPYQY